MTQTINPKTASDNKSTIAILDGFAKACNAHDVAGLLAGQRFIGKVWQKQFVCKLFIKI